MGSKWCDSQSVITVSDLGNAIDMVEQWPKLSVPNYQMIEAIEPDDLIMLTHQGERFWVKVDIVNITSNLCKFIGKIQDKLKYPHPFKNGDCITFEGKNILNIQSHEWKNEKRISSNE
jgi:hypothetical protein